MSEFTPADSGQLQRFSPVEIPEFDGHIGARDLRIPMIAWPEAEEDGETPKEIGDVEKARMTLNALTVLSRMSDHHGLAAQLSTKEGRDEFRRRHPNEHGDIRQMIADDMAEFKFWHRESVGSVRLKNRGVDPVHVTERQVAMRHKFEGRYADARNAGRRNARIKELRKFLVARGSVDQN